MIDIEVADSVTMIEVGMLGSRETACYPAKSGRKIRVRVPDVVGTGFLVVSTTGEPPHQGIVIPVVSP